MTQPDLSTLTVSQIRGLLAGRDGIDDALLEKLDRDSRRGVRDLARKERRRRKTRAAERARLETMLALERRLRSRGVRHIAGVDEAGRGPLAGPVVAAAVILPEDTLIPGLNDSKALTPERRDTLFDRIRECALAVSVGQATPEEIDRLNILQATLLAMRRAIEGLSIPPERVLVDGNQIPGGPHPEISVIDGDATSHAIAAASVIAKVTRDRQMVELDRTYPAYGFARHKGYGSADHLRAIREHGPCPIHRRSFRGVAEHLPRSEDFQVFAQGIDQAEDLDQLQAIGDSVAAARAALPDPELDELRNRYAARRTALSRPGPRGEAIAAATLREKGYHILARRYRAAGAELDIVARRRDTLAFVEVKTAGTEAFGPPESWVTPEKQRQIARAARAYLQRNPAPECIPRFDVIVVRLDAETADVRHLEAAFRLPDGSS